MIELSNMNLKVITELQKLQKLHRFNLPRGLWSRRCCTRRINSRGIIRPATFIRSLGTACFGRFGPWFVQKLYNNKHASYSDRNLFNVP